MPSFAAGLVVFCAAAAVLVLEILAGRLLAPYVGVTLETFTGIIGTVLAGISLGSWYGGKLADRIDPRKLLGPTIVLGGVFALATVPVVTFFGTPFAGGVAGRSPLAIVFLAFVGFFAPAAVLSAVTPTVVKLQLASLEETGSVVGRMSALATAGAILGTFITGFVLIAAMPTRPIIVSLGSVLVVAGLGLWWWLAPRREGSPASLAVIGLLAGALTFAVPQPCDLESAYYCAEVVVDEQRPTGRVLILDSLRHSYVDLADPAYLGFSYTQIFGDVLTALTAPPQPLDVLHIGGGGFTMPRYLRTARPGSRSVVLEIDPSLVDLAHTELGLEPGPDIEPVVGDARLSLRRFPPASFDVVIGDAFGGLAVPWHLTTVEFTEAIRERMRPGGIYMINVIDYPPLGFARAETATLEVVFDHVTVIAPQRRISGAQGGNFVLVASDHPIDADAIRAVLAARGADDVVAAGADLRQFVGDARPLTDDYAPVDQLLTPY